MIQLQLEVNDINKILNILSQAPFAQVADIINNIRGQVLPQLKTEVTE